MENLEDDKTHQVLEGCSGGTGGLVIMKKGPSSSSEASHTFKRPEIPKVSLLGLDRLAAAKREMQDEGSRTPKRSKVLSYLDEDQEEDVEEDDHDLRQKKSKDRDR